MDNKNDSIFGENLRKLRLEKGLTQTELGDLVGLSKRMIVHYEKHSSKPPTNRVSDLAKALNVKIDDLIKSNSKTKKQATVEDPKFIRKLEKAKSLPKEDKKLLVTMIDGLLKKNR